MHLRKNFCQEISSAAAFVFLFFYLLAFPALGALEPGKIITQYRVQVWNMEGGLTCLNLTTDTFTNYTTEQGLSKTMTTLLTGGQGLLSTNVLCLFEDQSGYLWIGTLEGLHRFKDGRLTSFTTGDGLSHNCITCIHRDSRGNTWIGTGNGLNRLTLNTCNFQGSHPPTSAGLVQ